ncbi:MAG: RluA family pseudouridine synthase [Chloroflexi bacterium]|nr:MAG: RluA family pseudouridine synthase [Chloroflexota bacterium]
MRTLELTADRGGERLDTFIARRCHELSRSHARRLIDEGLVAVDGRQAKPSERVSAGLSVSVTIPPPETINLQPEAIPLTIIYQDGDIIVLDKPAGLTVHPAPGHPSGTLVNALLAACPDLRGIAGALRPGIVHRLDKDTSGLMVVAKNDRAQRALQRQLKEREVRKTYLALVRAVPSPREGTIEAPIGRHPKNRKKMAVVADGRESTTRYRVREEIAGGKYSLLEVEPVTGRTHQIRVHLAAIGHPVEGDATYGRSSDAIGRQFLHAHKLAFAMPLGGRTVEFVSPLPADLREALSRLHAA